MVVSDTFGVEHSLQLTADSLYEAGLQALAGFRSRPMLDAQQPGPATQLKIIDHAPEHTVGVHRLLQRVNATGRCPKEHALKQKLRELLESP